MDVRDKLARKLVVSYLGQLGRFFSWLSLAFGTSSLLVTLAFPGEIGLMGMLFAPVFGLVIGIPITTVIWLVRGSWVTVCQGVVKHTVFRDRAISLHLKGQVVWQPKRAEGRLLRINPGTEIDVLQNVWGRQKVVWVDGERKIQELVLR